MKKRKILFCIIIVISFSLIAAKDGMCFPIFLRHLYHLLSPPKELYKPIITDHFLFDKIKFQKTYTLHPKYYDFYDLSIVFLDKNISSKYKFTGKLLVELLYKDTVVSKHIADSIVTAAYVGNDMSIYNKIALLNFEIPFVGKYKDNISVRITVLEIDQELKKYSDSIVLQIGVSPTP